MQEGKSHRLEEESNEEKAHSRWMYSIKVLFTCCLSLTRCPRGLIFTWWECYGLCLWHTPTELAHSFLFCLFVCFCLYGPFNCISFLKFSRHLSVFSLCSSCLISAWLGLSTICLFRKASLSPDIIPSGWLGSKHQPTNFDSFGVLRLVSMDSANKQGQGRSTYVTRR